MATKITKNSFQGGMDKDTDPMQVENIRYSDGYNVSLSQDGKYKQLSNFDGMATVASILGYAQYTTADDIHIMGMYYAETIIDGVAEDCILTFIYNGKTSSEAFYVYAVDVINSAVYQLYSESIVLSDKQRFVDCVVYKEGGTSYAYFTDGETPMKKIPMVVTGSGLGDATGGGRDYSRDSILLIRTGFRGNITDQQVARGTGGSLPNGSYQFSWRLLNNTTNKYTKWSSIQQPVMVGMGWDRDVGLDYQRSYGGVGYISDSEINLTLQLEENYEDGAIYADGEGLYTHYQLGVIENINGFKDRLQQFKILQPEPISDFNYATVPDVATATYTYSTNKVAHTIESIDELTIDDAAILAVRALAIKNNRLIVGGVTYHDLDYDNGEPTMGATSGAFTKILKSTLENDGSTGGANVGSQAVGYRDPDNSTNYVSYFRDEVYRFAITYKDEFGNWSRPKLLDLSGATGITNTTAANRVSEGKDFRFPPRTSARFGTLIDASGDISALGLKLVGIKNHPTWAKGFAILRAPRRKKILFQTPVVPSILVMPAKAVGEYPAQRRDEEGLELDLLNVEAANPVGSFFPKNFFHILTKSILRFSDFYGIDTGSFGRVFGSNTYVEKQIIFNSSISATTPIWTTALPTETLMYTGNSTDSTLTLSWSQESVIVKPWTASEDPALTVGLYRRDVGTDDVWTLVSETASYYTATTEFTLDLSLYDYYITCVENATSAPPRVTNAIAYDTMGWNDGQAERVDLTWTVMSSNATGFKIYRNEDVAPLQGGALTLLATIEDPTANLYEDLACQDQYYYRYRVDAYNAFGTGTGVVTAEVQCTL